MTIGEGIQKLARLAETQGHITYSDINETFPDEQFSAADLDRIYLRLRALEIEVLDRAGD